MHTLIGAFGTRGDVQPMLVLALALRARGHRVTLVVPPEGMALVEGRGLEVHTAGMSYLEVSQRIAAGRIREVLGVLPLMRRQVDVHLAALEPLAAGVDLIIGSSVFIAGPTLSALTGRPYAYFAFAPTMLDGVDNAGPLVPLFDAPFWLNRGLWAATHALWNVAARGPLNRLRAERRLPPAPDVWREVLGAHPVLACDPRLGPAPLGHPVSIAQPGAFFLEDGAPVSAETEAFLGRGEPPVYIGFGSMSDPSPRETTQRLVRAGQLAGVRLIISRGWAELGGIETTDDVHLAGPEPHGALFPRCLGVVHHGGAGTTHAAARAGVPQVVLPQVLDQFYWRHRTRAVGIAGDEASRYSPDPWNLALALRSFRDRQLQARARAFAQGLSRDGVDQAAVLLERLATSRRN